MPNYQGTSGDDSYWGGAEADRIEGLGGRDYLLGNGGDDEIFGGDGDDNLHGGDGNDVIDAGEGNDSLQGNRGTDILRGMDGDDRLLVLTAPEGDTFDGGEGVDTLQFDGFGVSARIAISLADPSVVQNLAGATLVNVEKLSFRGGSGNDDITGGALADYIDGYDGDDRVDGGLGDDNLDGGFGNDTIYGGGGDDKIGGGPTGTDEMHGGDGDDELKITRDDALIDGGDGIDLINIESGGSTVLDLSGASPETSYGSTTIRNVERLTYFGWYGADQVTGGAYSDSINGNDGNDVIAGGGGDDILSGGGGIDELRGGGGDDFLHSYESGNVAGDSVLDGGDGFDRLEIHLASYSGFTEIDLLVAGRVTGVEQINFTGGLAGNRVLGGEARDTMGVSYFATGANEFHGRGGNDDLFGGSGADLLFGGADNDWLSGGRGSDELYGGDGDDRLRDEQFNTDVNILDGGAGDDEVVGGAGADIIRGGGGNDYLDGGAGADEIDGGAGDDRFVVDTEADRIVEGSGGGTDTVLTSLASFSLAGRAHVENLTGQNTAGQSLTGNELDNTITGMTGPDQLFGGAGNDVLFLDYDGDDTASGGANNDILFYGAALTAADSNDGGDGTDTLVLQGTYRALVFAAASLTRIEGVSLQSGTVTRWGQSGVNSYDYNVAMHEANAAPGQQLRVNGQSLGAGEDFAFNGSAETDGGRFLVYGGFGVDTLTGGAGSDIFFFEAGRLGGGDRIVGGGGNDAVVISGAPAGATGPGEVTIASGMLSGVEALSFNGRFASDPTARPSYDVVIENGNLAGGATLIVNASSLGTDQSLSFSGWAVGDGRFRIFGGAGGDSLKGGANDDVIEGGGLADALAGGYGRDVFVYRYLSDSAGNAPDVIADFHFGNDKIDLSLIDANAAAAGDQAFAWIGGNAFSRTAGELRVASDGGANMWALLGDVNGDAVADFRLLVSTGAGPPPVADIIL
jgi:Ca2+-binding RTX toxin-like protein